MAQCVAVVLSVHQIHAQTVPVNFSGGGLTSFDGWVNMNSVNFPGFGGFPGNSPWLNPDKSVKTAGSNASNSGDAEIVRVSGGQDGGPIFLSESLYFGSFVQVANALGGTLRVSEPSPVSGVKTVTLQVQIGEAIGYGFVQPSGAPVLKINGLATTYAPTYSKVVNTYQNGVYDSPDTGEEPVYVKTWAFQWNVANLGTINSIQIEFSAVTHAQIYSMRLDQTSVLQSNNVFEPNSSVPVINLSGSGLGFGNVVVGSTKTGTLTIQNTGTAALTVTNISYPSPVFTGAWSGTVAAGASQNVTVTFNPAAAQSYSGNITVNSSATVGTNTIAVSGTGTAAPTRVINLLGNLAFGGLTVGQSTNRPLTISNSGNATLNVTNISYPQGFRGSWTNGTIGLAPGASTNITVTFAPTNAQLFSNNITVGSDATSGSNTILASGTGTPVPSRVINVPTALSFSNCPVGSSNSATLTISNGGNAPLTVSNIVYPSGFSGAWSGSIPAANSQNVSVLFTPTAAGDFGGTISVVSDATAGGNAVSVSARGTPPTIALVRMGIPVLIGSNTVVTNTFRSTPATWLDVAFTDNIAMSNSWIRHPSRVYSAGGEFDVVLTNSGDHRTNWQRGMFFRLLYPTKP
jgi:hypothetical protein